MRERLARSTRSLRSVRVRITAAATVLVAIAVTLAAFGVLRAVESQLVDGVRSRSSAQVDLIAKRLSVGISPADAVLIAERSGMAAVQVRDVQGNDLVAATGPASRADSVFSSSVGVLEPGESGSTQVVPTVPMDAVTQMAPTYEVAYAGVSTPDGEPLTVLAASPLDGVRESVAALRGPLAVGLLSLVVLMGWIAWYTTGRALRPVEVIRAEVEAISSGTLHRRVLEPATGDEVARLARTMNAMLDRLESAATRQRQFASDASHELRSPVAAIRTEVEVALRDPAADWPSVGERVLAEEGRLESLVADLLLLATVEEGSTSRGIDEPARPRDQVDLVALARDEAQRSRRVPVGVQGPTEPIAVVEGRRGQLGRVLANVIDNAARHAETEVEVRVAREGDRVLVTVDDDGPGVATDDRDRVFERFVRLDPARARSGEGGAGLGLALVRAVVEAHHGSVRIEAAPVLGGARLLIELPAPRS